MGCVSAVSLVVGRGPMGLGEMPRPPLVVGLGLPSGYLPWMACLAVIAVLAYLLGRRHGRREEARPATYTWGLEDALKVQTGLMERYAAGFSVALFDIDQFQELLAEQGPSAGDRMLGRLARLLHEESRQTDLVARFGDSGLAAIMPHTDLEGAGVLAEQVRVKTTEQLPITVSAAVASADDGDDPYALMSRAQVALRAAKAAGQNCVYRHTGERVESVLLPAAASD